MTATLIVLALQVAGLAVVGALIVREKHRERDDYRRETAALIETFRPRDECPFRCEQGTFTGYLDIVLLAGYAEDPSTGAEERAAATSMAKERYCYNTNGHWLTDKEFADLAAIARCIRNVDPEV